MTSGQVHLLYGLFGIGQEHPCDWSSWSRSRRARAVEHARSEGAAVVLH